MDGSMSIEGLPVNWRSLVTHPLLLLLLFGRTNSPSPSSSSVTAGRFPDRSVSRRPHHIHVLSSGKQFLLPELQGKK
jgi:hypothetical protein